MSKLNSFEKSERRAGLENLADIGGEMFSLRLERVTVVVQPAIVGARGGSRFVQVTAAICSPSDRFRRKRGELIALRRALFGAGGLMLPVNHRTYEQIAFDVVNLIRG